MMPPYGTPPHPYVAMYPPGGMYGHPSMPPVRYFYCSGLCTETVWLLIISLTYFVLYQGSYPYSPYAMPSPNGMTEASVSLRLLIDNFLLLLPFFYQRIITKRLFYAGEYYRRRGW